MLRWSLFGDFFVEIEVYDWNVGILIFRTNFFNSVWHADKGNWAIDWSKDLQGYTSTVMVN